jgi:hypothetical protein
VQNQKNAGEGTGENHIKPPLTIGKTTSATVYPKKAGILWAANRLGDMQDRGNR